MDLKELTDTLLATNLCTYFVLPLLGVNKLRFGGEANFLNSFLSTDGTLIYVEVYQPEFVLGTNLPEHKTCTDNNGKDYLEFKIPEEFRSDVKLFMEGKYSQMSESTKQTIRELSTLRYKDLKGAVLKTDVRLMALEKSEVLRNYWIEQLYDRPGQSHIHEDMELMSKPDESSYLTGKLTYT